jgi:hypothetical protein
MSQELSTEGSENERKKDSINCDHIQSWLNKLQE